MARRLWVRRAAPTGRTEAPGPTISGRGPGDVVFGLILLGVLVGLAFVAQDHWKQGLSLIGVTLLAGCAARLLLPASRLGLLVVRSRLFDAVTLAVLGAAILLVTFQVPLPHR